MSAHDRIAGSVALAAVSCVLALALAGCVDQSPAPTSTPTNSATASHTPTPTPTATPTPTPTPTPTSSPDVPVTTSCSTILTAQQVYSYNPNVVRNTSYRPATGSTAAQLVAHKGRACGWLNETSNVQLDVAVAEPASAALAAAKTLAATNSTTLTLTDGAIGYFTTSDGVGELQLFLGSDWVVISSGDFAEAGDSKSIADTVAANLKLG